MQYTAQLSVWQSKKGDDDIGIGILAWCNNHNIGIISIADV